MCPRRAPGALSSGGDDGSNNLPAYKEPALGALMCPGSVHREEAELRGHIAKAEALRVNETSCPLSRKCLLFSQMSCGKVRSL